MGSNISVDARSWPPFSPKDCRPVILSVATGNPPHKLTLEACCSWLDSLPGMQSASRFARNAAIDHRFISMPDIEAFGSPSTAERIVFHQEVAGPLCERVARSALKKAAVDPSEIDHVVFVTSTGLAAPGIDTYLIRELGLPPNVRRTVVGFMGCAAGFNGLRVAVNHCQAHPGLGRVLVVCCELSSVHFRHTVDNTANNIASVIFGDGVCALVVASLPRQSAVGKLEVMADACKVIPDTEDVLTWSINNSGFVIHFGNAVKSTVRRCVEEIVIPMLSQAGLQVPDVDWWAFHPGGKRLLDGAQQVLNLTDEHMAPSRTVLRENGNMASATIFFILERLLDHKGDVGTMVGFGPGFCVEACLLRRVT